MRKKIICGVIFVLFFGHSFVSAEETVSGQTTPLRIQAVKDYSFQVNSGNEDLKKLAAMRDELTKNGAYYRSASLKIAINSAQIQDLKQNEDQIKIEKKIEIVKQMRDEEQSLLTELDALCKNTSGSLPNENVKNECQMRRQEAHKNIEELNFLAGKYDTELHDLNMKKGGQE